MGLFHDMMTKIFHAGANAAPPPDAAKPGVVPQSRVQAANPTAAPAPSAAQAPVDVAANLEKMAAASKEKLDWKHSIVDLMKLVGMDSSLSARKELAADLKYTGDTNDSASMNIWLHKEVMRKLSENGGKVPAELLVH
ncbi:MAG: DUF3597 domain-containing protein [Acidobacteriota bacterium]